MDRHSFFPPSEAFSLRELANRCQAELVDEGAGSSIIRGVSPVYRAKEGDVCFIASRKYRAELETCAATAIICGSGLEGYVPAGISILRATSPQTSFALMASLLYPAALRPTQVQTSGISPSAHVDPTARLEADVSIEPFAVIGAGVEIGAGTHIGSSVTIGPGVKIGRGCSIASNVTLACTFIGNNVIIHSGARIGQDGFGFAPSATGMVKIVQIGRVIIQDNVEIGANTTIDRGAMDDTVIGEGTKIDNLVQIGHNVRVGRHTAMASGVGVAGSTVIGSGVQIGGAAGVNGHISIGDGAQIAGMSGVITPVPAGAKYGGMPARPLGDFLRESAEIMVRAEGRLKRKGENNG